MNITEYQNYHETKSHTAADFPYNTYLCTIPLDFTSVPPHWHDTMEWIVIKKGEGIVSVDLQAYHVNEGDVVIILPGHLHSISQKDNACMEYENIIFDISMLISGKSDLCANQFITPLVQGNTVIDTHIFAARPYYDELIGSINKIDELCSSRPDGYQLAVKGYLFQLLFLLLTYKKKRASISKSKTKSLEKLKTIIKYIEEHYSQSITIDEMAALTFYSKSHFMKFFKANMGMGFTEYLNDYRLTIASRLLTTSSASILEIAGQTGFDNLSYFNRLFKRKFHDTPSHFRTLVQV